MLEISEQQMDALRAARQESYLVRAKSFAREHVPQVFGPMSEAQLDSVVRQCREVAIAHHVVSEHGFALWLYFSGKMGPDFYKNAAIARELRESTSPDATLSAWMDAASHPPNGIER